MTKKPSFKHKIANKITVLNIYLQKATETMNSIKQIIREEQSKEEDTTDAISK